MSKYSIIAEKVSKKYEGLTDLSGIIWVGSATHGICDKYVDIDIKLILKDPNEAPMDQYIFDGIKIEVDVVNMDWLLSEQTQSPDTEQFWIRDSAKILFDPGNNLGNRFRKANSIPEQAWSDLEWQLFNNLFNSYDYQKTAQRGEFVASQMYVSKTVEVLSRFLFVYHRRAVPTFKWRWYFVNKDKLFDMEKIDKLFHHLEDNERQFRLLEEIEDIAREMLRQKGVAEEKIMEPWRF